MSKKVFLSHVSDEHLVAAGLKARLIGDFLGLVDVFVSSDGESIAAGEQWLASIEAALADCHLLVTLCSPTSIRRPWINFEAGAAWMRKIPLVPICHAGLEPSDLPMPLSLRQGISLNEPNGLSRLYSQVANVLGCKVPQVDFTALASELSELSAKLPNASAQHENAAALAASRSARVRLLEALQHPRFKWRSLDKLAAVAAVSADEVADLLRTDAGVRFSRGKSGEVIVGLRARVGNEH